LAAKSLENPSELEVTCTAPSLGMTNFLLPILAVVGTLFVTEVARPWFAFFARRLWVQGGKPLRRWFRARKSGRR
jgi:hypothetical protein